MARSLKKGYFIDDHLIQKVEAMNSKGDRRVIRTWRKRLEEKILRARLDRMRRSRRFDVIDGGDKDEYIH